MKDKLLFVSVIIPCRNEEKFIEKCLQSILGQTHPKERFEILVVDGMSEDRTRQIAENYSDNVKVFDNPKEIFPVAFNVGIKNARGDLIVIIGCHATYPNNYIEQCVEYSRKYGADNVGGKVEPVPYEKTIISKAIAISLKGFFGKSRDVGKESRLVDTVFGGCYRREVFQKIGFFNENLIRSSDMEFNMRIKRNGGKIILVPDLVVYYYPKSTLLDFFKHNIKDGIWVILPFKFIKRPLKLRHYIPLIFVLTLLLSIWFYIPINLYFSSRIALREKDLRYFFIMPIVFFSRHFAYGLGSVLGFIKLII